MLAPVLLTTTYHTLPLCGENIQSERGVVKEKSTGEKDFFLQFLGG
jgi:hypothetical protein